MQMNRERKNQIRPIFKILCLNKKGQVVEHRDFCEAKVLDFYVNWCLEKNIQEVQVLDISLSQVFCLAIYKRINGKLTMVT